MSGWVQRRGVVDGQRAVWREREIAPGRVERVYSESPDRYAAVVGPVAITRQPATYSASARARVKQRRAAPVVRTLRLTQRVSANP